MQFMKINNDAQMNLINDGEKKMNKKDYLYIGIIIALAVPLIFMVIDRKGQTEVCYEVFENIINSEE